MSMLVWEMVAEWQSMDDGERVTTLLDYACMVKLAGL